MILFIFCKDGVFLHAFKLSGETKCLIYGEECSKDKVTWQSEVKKRHAVLNYEKRLDVGVWSFILSHLSFICSTGVSLERSWDGNRSIWVVTGLSAAAGIWYCSISEQEKEKKKTCESWEEYRATLSEDCSCIHEAFAEPQITDYVEAVTPGDVYLFTTKGPSLKSHSRRNRLNAGPGEKKWKHFKEELEQKDCVETVASTLVIFTECFFLELKQNFRQNITKSVPVCDKSDKTKVVQRGEMTPHPLW